MGGFAVAGTQEHELGAVVFPREALHLGEKLASDAAASFRLCDDEVFHNAEGLGAVHGVGTKGEKNRSAQDAAGLGDEEVAGLGCGKGGDLFRENADLRILHQLAVEVFNRRSIVAHGAADDDFREGWGSGDGLAHLIR